MYFLSFLAAFPMPSFPALALVLHRDVELDDAFLQRGGTELAPMSTTSDPSVAVQYAAGQHSVVMRIHTTDSFQRGADIGFLSCAPLCLLSTPQTP